MTLLDTLIWMVDTPSELGDEAELCTALEERLGRSYAAADLIRIGNSLVVGSPGRAPLVLLVGHIDTVPSQGQPPAHVQDGRLFGLGASDMKSGLAVITHLLESGWVRSGPYSVVGVFYDGEEGPAAGNNLETVLQQVPWLTRAEFAVVMEPTDGRLEVGCNGSLNATVRFRGKSAHSARPWWGENAVTKAGEWLTALHRREPQPVIIDGLEFREVFTVTRAQGGIANNILPPVFELNLNHRFPPVYSLEEAEERLREVAAPADEVEIVDRAPAGPVPEGNVHLDRLAAASGAERASKQGWTDVARLAQYGIPAVNYGPGEAIQAHKADESVPIANLDTVFTTMRAFLEG